MTTDITEFEAKFYPINKDRYRLKLRKLGAKLIIPERKMRRSIVDHRAYPQFKCHYIRVRDEGNLVRLSAKTHAEQTGKVSDQKEVDVIVGDYDKTIQIIELMGFKFNRVQETLRETWELDGAEITLDTWPGLDPYSEIEASSEEQVKQTAEKLGFNWNKKIITPAAEIFAEVYQISIDETLKKISNLSFENNPFAKMAKHNIINAQKSI